MRDELLNGEIFYTLAEAAEILRVNPSTLSRQCQAGTFPHARIGRTILHILQ